MDRFTKLAKVGAGTYGVVYRARENRTGRLVAMKKVRLGDNCKEEGVSRSALREIKILKEIQSPFVVELVDVFLHKGNLWVVMELCDGDLEQVIQGRLGPSTTNTLTEPQIKAYFHQILLGLSHLHAQHLIHRDVKPNNILFGRDGLVKLIDFGLARPVGTPEGVYTSRVFQIWYRAPELLLGARAYGPGVDAWAAGCVLAEMFRGRPLFQTDRDSEIAQLSLIFDTLGTPSADELYTLAALPGTRMMLPGRVKRGVGWGIMAPRASPEALDLLKRMLCYTPEARLSVREALLHPFITGGVPKAPTNELPHRAKYLAAAQGFYPEEDEDQKNDDDLDRDETKMEPRPRRPTPPPLEDKEVVCPGDEGAFSPVRRADEVAEPLGAGNKGTGDNNGGNVREGGAARGVGKGGDGGPVAAPANDQDEGEDPWLGARRGRNHVGVLGSVVNDPHDPGRAFQGGTRSRLAPGEESPRASKRPRRTADPVVKSLFD